MTLASWLVASRNRAGLLAETIASLQRSVIPDGWSQEIVVCAPPGDAGLDVARAAGCVTISAAVPDVGPQNTAAFRASAGALLLVSGDDDLQSPMRLRAAVAAYEAGQPLSGCGMFLMLNRDTGQWALWEGPSHRVGALRNYARTAVAAADGWGDCARNADGALQDRMERAGVTDPTRDLAREIGLTCVVTWSAKGNISPATSRAWPNGAQTVRVGPFLVRRAAERDLAALDDWTRKAADRCR